ncbi:hypothetical protein ACEPPN_016228 [Leptodophora sp. 'Broadleaf-Isolate-01']
MSQPGQSQPSFDTLPGEIRNQIFALCIWHALSHPNADKSNWPDTRPPFSQWHPPPRKWLTAAVYSPSSDTGYLKLSGIGSLPVLLVNKQTYAEVSSLVFALVDSVSIGASMPQYLDENPIQSWISAYSLVEERPDLQKLVKHAKIILPRTRGELLIRAYESCRGIHRPQTPRKNNAWPNIPSLHKFLGKFESLESLTIVLIADTQEAPDFKTLLPLWRKFGDRLTMKFKERAIETHIHSFHTYDQFSSSWNDAWERCLAEQRNDS